MDTEISEPDGGRRYSVSFGPMPPEAANTVVTIIEPADDPLVGILFAEKLRFNLTYHCTLRQFFELTLPESLPRHS
jgi:hypothetical protein